MARRQRQRTRSRIKRAMAQLCKRDTRPTHVTASPIDRDILAVIRAEVGRRRQTTQHIPRNGQWCGIYPGYPKDHGLYDQSKEEAGQCQAILHQGRTSYKGRAPFVSYTFEDGRKPKAKNVPVPVPELTKTIVKRDSLLVTHRRKRVNTLD
jgi:hypothetical protein